MPKNKLVYTPTDEEAEAKKIIETEKTAWETEEVQVTDDVSFSMRERIKTARRYYWGVFDKPYDANNREKKWLHMVLNFCELFIRNIDIDTKDINIKAKKKQNYGLAEITRFVVRHYLTKLKFGEKINDFIRRLVIDGTAVQKNMKGLGKEVINSKNVDLLNVIIDPNAESIQQAGIIERHVMTIDDFRKMPWDNKEYVEGRTDVKLYSDTSKKAQGGVVPEVVVYERWNKIPKSLITKKESDKNEWIEGVIIASGIEEGNTVIHKIIENPRKDKRKPYEEAWFIKVPGRWYGVGIPEILFDLQEIVNENANSILNNTRVLQNKLFKARRGSGITQTMLSRLSDGGVIPVKNLSDIEEFQITDNRAGAFDYEDRLYSWAQRVTGGFTFPGAGEPLPASSTATSALLQQQNAKTSFDLVIEGLGLALERIIQDHWLPIIFSKIDPEEIIRITGEADELETLDEAYIKAKTMKMIPKMLKEEKRLPSREEMNILQEAVRRKLEDMGSDRYIREMKKELFDFDYEVEVYVTMEKFDKVTMISELRQILVELSQVPDLNLDLSLIAKEMLDFMGFGGRRFLRESPMAMPERERRGAPKRAPQMPAERTQQAMERMAAKTPAGQMTPEQQ